jgi:hypothetical protein
VGLADRLLGDFSTTAGLADLLLGDFNPTAGLADLLLGDLALELGPTFCMPGDGNDASTERKAVAFLRVGEGLAEAFKGNLCDAAGSSVSLV